MRECVRLCGRHVGFHRLPANSGKGAAVYSGWDLDYESEWLGLLDADGSIPPCEVLRLLSYLERMMRPTPFLPLAAKSLVARSSVPCFGISSAGYLRRWFQSELEYRSTIHNVVSS